ncbi:unnamed protein product [Psylliodes chrysocephalus]|uniref:Serpin domain-containing protein n=1 Tax=Psylliodes chrysocephalus TaxID=3402493 RepID=A0A9P0GA83_9CUCU|nr:unnamed protein product [Psylliodes chrysocephala]
MKCAIILLVCACAVWAAPTEEDNLQALAVGNRQFAASVYKEILKTNQGNLIYSPFSAQVVLALLSAGANGPSHDEIVTGVSLPSSQEKIQKAFKEFLPKLKSDTEKLKLLSANKVYVGQDVKLEPSFQKIAVEIYDSSAENVDFSKNEVAAAHINEWVESQTNHKIQNLVDKDSLSSDTALVLVNALYMSAKWSSTFSEYATRPEKFYKTAKDTVDVPTMSQINHFNYYDNTELGAQFLELPYEADGLSMVIVLPHEKEGLKALESNVEKLFAPQPLKRERVDVKLPKFQIDSEIKFVEILKSLGVKKIFEEDADLKGLSANKKRLYVSEVIQKAFINVTESGTEAAAATAGMIEDRIALRPRPSVPKIFHADHPFTYYIQTNGIVLFGGHVLKTSG